MRVIQATGFGAPGVLVLRNVPDPSAGPGQVVVDVAVAPTLFLDTQVRGGQAPWMSVTPPYVPGVGVAGHGADVVFEGVGGDIGRAVFELAPRRAVGSSATARPAATSPRSTCPSTTGGG